MFRKLNPQQSLFQSCVILPNAWNEELENSWAEVFRSEALPLIPEHEFAHLYHGDTGRPNFPVALLVALSIIKELLGLTDALLIQAFHFNLIDLPHRSRWPSYTPAEKRLLIHQHAATVFEDFCRARFPGSQRYWEHGLELDLVAPDPDHAKGLLVAEVKWRLLSAGERQNVLREFGGKWERSSLRTRYPEVRFEVFDACILAG